MNQDSYPINIGVSSDGELAQLVERLLCKQDVSGSSPLFSIAHVAELVDALGLGSSRFICGGSSPLMSISK